MKEGYIMKKIIYLLSLLLVFTLIGYSGEPQEIKYESSYITARFVSGIETGREVAFSDEDVSGVLAILNDSKWDKSLCKCGYEYFLYLDGNMLYYSYERGIINDYENDRNLKLSDEDKTYINSLIDELYK